MNWTSALSVLKETKTPRGYEIGQLRGEDVAGAIEGLREWYPEIGVGAESCHLTHEFYATETTLAGSVAQTESDLTSSRPSTILHPVSLFTTATTTTTTRSGGSGIVRAVV